MRITLATPTTIRLAFPYNAATVAFVKALPGAEWDKETKTWTVSLVALSRLVQRFLRSVEIDYAALVAREDLWRRWVQQHNYCGIRFALVAGVVEPTGPGVSPEFVKHVASRSAQIAPWLGCQIEAGPLITPLAQSFLEPSDGEALLLRSMRNAAKNEEKKAALVKRMKAKRFAGKQAELEME